MFGYFGVEIYTLTLKSILDSLMVCYNSHTFITNFCISKNIICDKFI